MADVAVRKATRESVRQLGGVMGRAFQEDPAFAWAAPNAKRRERFGPRYFELLLERIYLPKGEVWMSEDGMAAALWAPPGQWEVPTMATLPLFPVMVRACGRNLPVALRMLSLMDAKHKLHDEPHYYLAFAGTEPASQGRGYGTALLSNMVERCDAEGVGAYLESTSQRNQVLYFRHGFEVVEELEWPRGGPPFWRMWRSAR
jgi:GNAT superfamily N-acetyltransferase